MKHLKMKMPVIPKETFIQDIPQEFSSDLITAAVKTRMKLDESKQKLLIVIVATVQGNLLFFRQKKLVKNLQLPFKNTSEILVYRSQCANKEFIITFSTISCGAAVVDLQFSKVVKEWTNVSKVEVKDERLIGHPQVLIYSNQRRSSITSPEIVTYESNWEDVSPDDPLTASKEKNNPLQNVVKALEAQLNNTNNHLLVTEGQISLRRAMLNRSLTALQSTILHSSSSNPVQPPSYSLGGSAERNEISRTDAQNTLVKFSEVWHFKMEDIWISGTTFTNTSQKILSDVQCIFTPALGTVMHSRLSYYKFTSKASSVNVYELLELSKTDSAFDGNLDSNQSLTVVVTTSVPEFQDTDADIGNLFLSCRVSKGPRVQIHLGSCRLTFIEALSGGCDFDPMTTDIAKLRRHILGLISVLQFEKAGLLTTLFSSASESFTNIAKRIGMHYLAPLQCYYSHGLAGHICVLTEPEDPHRLRIVIQADSKRKMDWFIRSLQSVLPDDGNLLLNPENLDEVVNCPLRHLASSIALLSGVEEERQVEDELMVIEEAVNETPLDKIRNAFLQKQTKIVALSRGRPSGNILKVPTESYRNYLKQYCIAD